MLTRRVLLGQASAAVASAALLGRTRGAAATTVRSAVNFAIPRGACDCHVHVFGDAAIFPFAEKRIYTPPQASVEQLLELQRDLHLDRVVVVQPSVYGADNACTSDAAHRFGGDGTRRHSRRATQSGNQYRGTLRSSRCQSVARHHGRTNSWLGLACADLYPHIGDRGSQESPRPNAVSGGCGPFRPRQSGARCDASGLCRPARTGQIGSRLCQNLGRLSRVGTGARLCRGGAARAGAGRRQSRPNRLGHRLATFPNSDYGRGKPLSEISPPFPIDDGLLLNQLPKWVPDAALRKKILVDNPARLYGFEPVAG